LRRFPQVEFAKSSMRDGVSTPPRIRSRNAFLGAFSKPSAFEGRAVRVGRFYTGRAPFGKLDL
jgi:hypothetical protein